VKKLFAKATVAKPAAAKARAANKGAAKPSGAGANPVRRRKPLKPRRPAEPRIFRIGIGALGAGLFLLSLLLTWGFSVTWLLLSGNSLAASAVSRLFEAQEQHEQRVLDYQRQIEAFQAEVDRLTREQEFARTTDAGNADGAGGSLGGVERKVIEIARRQGQIEARQQALTRLTEQAGAALTQSFSAPAAGAVPVAVPVPAGGARPPVRPRAPEAGTAQARPANAPAAAGASQPARPGQPPAATPAPQPVAAPAPAPAPAPRIFAPGAPVPDSTVGTRPAGAPAVGAPRGLGPLSQVAVPSPVALAQGPAFESLDDQAARLDGRVKEIERQQMRALDVFEKSTQRYASLLQESLNLAGRGLADLVEQPRVARSPRQSGPPSSSMVVLPKSEERSPFGLSMTELQKNLVTIQRLRPTAEALPLARPVGRQWRTSSPFGPRFHPIYAVERLHAGLDFATPIGTPIHATGAGIVLSAGWAGGYGWLVQVDHGQSLVTRYAHLSEMLVSPGQPVAVGTVIGLAGNTGGSTGPHLHYETRVDDEPVDPVRFLSIGEQLGLRPR
jgi:murein DD-endopeptidase MepM/ murein hydrolase activator NlpD